MHLRKYAALVCVFDLASLVLIAVGVVTSQWVISDVSDDGAANRGEVSLGLFRTSYSIRFKEADYREEETSPFSFYDGVFTFPVFFGSIVFIFLALVMTLVSLCLAVLTAFSFKSLRTYKPIAMLTFNLVAWVCGVIGFGLFVALYVQDMDNILSTEMQELFPSLRTDAKLGYSFFLLVAGTAALCFALVFSPLEKTQLKRRNIQTNNVNKDDAVEPQGVETSRDRFGELIDSVMY